MIETTGPSNRLGYDDVRHFLPLDGQLNWLDFRERMSRRESDLELAGSDEGEAYRVGEWILDDCPKLPLQRYAGYFQSLDAWTEYWDLYHKETNGIYYFGTEDAPGYLNRFLPSPSKIRNPVFDAWKRIALNGQNDETGRLQRQFEAAARAPEVVEAVLAVDTLVRGLVREHFSAGRSLIDGDAYLDAMERFGKNTLPECPERYKLIADDDPRKPTALHHTIEGDIMWFGWAVHLECAELTAPKNDEASALRSLMTAGVILGCSFDFAFRGRRRTRKEYVSADRNAWRAIWNKALSCRKDFTMAASEVRELFSIREFGET